MQDTSKINAIVAELPVAYRRLAAREWGLGAWEPLETWQYGKDVYATMLSRLEHYVAKRMQEMQMQTA